MARILDQVCGHQAIIQGFLNGLATDHLAHSFLFVGPQGVGKSLTAHGFAQALVCERGNQACGECPSCVRISSGTSESLLVVAAENGQIKVDVSRQIIRKLSLQTSGKSQIVIIEDAHSLNPQAANALLKMIEEPPRGCYFFLIAPSTSSVLATIRSRCQIFRFAPLKQSDLKSLADPATPEWQLRASRGSLARLRRLEDEDLQAVRQQAAHILWWGLFDNPDFYEGEWRKGLKDKERIELLIEFMTTFLRDALVLQQGGHDIINADYEDLLTGLAERSEVPSLAERMPQLSRAIKGNAEPQLAFERLFLGVSQNVLD